MKQARYILIGGFLGAGKTTAILELARRLQAEGKKVGLITNDQSFDLVDTARARASGFEVEEISGGCFCCKFDSLVQASRVLDRASAPEILIAEPVGSCTDLVATVAYPLRQLYGDQYRVSPVSVVVDPRRCAGILGLEPKRRFSDKVIYVYRKQLEEAEIIAVNKIDGVTAQAREELRAALGKEFPEAEILDVSCLTGEGLDEWFGRILTGELGRRRSMEIDYDEYAEGEFRLGWLNVRGSLAASADFDGNELLEDLVRAIGEMLAAAGVEIAHLKATLSPAEGPEVASVSLTRTGESPQLTHRIHSPLDRGELMINLRAEAEPDRLEETVLSALAGREDFRFETRHVAAFRPGRPCPTHRMASAEE